MATVAAAASTLLWYLKEFTGENDYARYTEQQRRRSPHAPVLSRREFERTRMDEREKNPQQRCC